GGRAAAVAPQRGRPPPRRRDRIALGGPGALRADYAEPATGATVCAALQVPVADWAPVIRPAGEIAFSVVQPGNGLAGAQAAWHGIWDYSARGITAKRPRLERGPGAHTVLAMNQDG